MRVRLIPSLTDSSPYQLLPFFSGMVVQQQVQVKSKEKCKMEQTTLDVVIEKGMAPGAEIKFERMSEQKPVRDMT